MWGGRCCIHVIHQKDTSWGMIATTIIHGFLWALVLRISRDVPILYPYPMIHEERAPAFPPPIKIGGLHAAIYMEVDMVT